MLHETEMDVCLRATAYNCFGLVVSHQCSVEHQADQQLQQQLHRQTSWDFHRYLMFKMRLVLISSLQAVNKPPIFILIETHPPQGWVQGDMWGQLTPPL